MFSYPDVLIVKLEAHLEQIKDIIAHRTFVVTLTNESMNAVYDEVKLMLALIEGAKEF